jgi:pilus assembly protein CpaC
LLLGGLAVLLLGLIGPHAWGQLCTPEAKPLVVLLNSASRLQMSSRKAIRTVVNPKEGVVTIRTIDRDPTTVLLVGAAPGVTRLELEDADGFRETREVVVQPDVEYLTRQLKAAFPATSFTVTPIGPSSIALSGYISRAEEGGLIERAAQQLGFQVANNLRVHGVQQVQLDVVIARVRRTKARNFGFTFLQNTRQQLAGSAFSGILPTVQAGLVGIGGQGNAILGPAQFGQAINSAPGNANLFGGLIGSNYGFLAFLQALENEGLAKLLAQPRLVTKSGQPASFLDGGEQAVPVPAGLGVVGVQFEEFGTRLNFLPIVLGNGRIHLEVEPEVSVLDANAGVAIAGATVPGRATQRIHTTVEMEAGQTFVIGGLIQKASGGNALKVPVIGQIPFLGAAFSQKSFTDDETELVVMVTPHLVDAQSACQVAKVLPGEESRSPDDFELFLEGLLEAPRGPRAVFQNGRYVPAHFNGPTAGLLPCAGRGDGLLPCTHEKIGLGLGGAPGWAAGCGEACGTACRPGMAASLPPAAPLQGQPAPEMAARPSAPPIPLAPPPGAANKVEEPPMAVPVSGPLTGDTAAESSEAPRQLPLPPISGAPR